MNSNNPFDMQLLVPVELSGSNTTLVMTNPAFLKLVMAAACRILDSCHPDSYNYRSPVHQDNGAGDSFDGEADRMDSLAGMGKWPGRLRTTGQYHYLSMHCQLDLILEYVKLRDALYQQDKYIVGEEAHIFQMVYAAVCAFHRWKVVALDAAIEKQGTEFGSATGWFKTSYKELVAEWPARYKLETVPFELLDIPINRPDWEDRREAYFISRVGTLLDVPGKKTVRLRRQIALEKQYDPKDDLTVWSYDPEAQTLFVHDKGPNFDVEGDTVSEFRYSDVSYVGDVYVRS